MKQLLVFFFFVLVHVAHACPDLTGVYEGENKTKIEISQTVIGGVTSYKFTRNDSYIEEFFADGVLRQVTREDHGLQIINKDSYLCRGNVLENEFDLYIFDPDDSTNTYGEVGKVQFYLDASGNLIEVGHYRATDHSADEWLYNYVRK